jgi:hypothetical protein
MTLSETTTLLCRTTNTQHVMELVAEQAHEDCQGNRRATLEWAALHSLNGYLRVTSSSAPVEWQLVADEQSADAALPSLVSPSLQHELSRVWSQCTPIPIHTYNIVSCLDSSLSAGLQALLLGAARLKLQPY